MTSPSSWSQSFAWRWQIAASAALTLAACGDRERELSDPNSLRGGTAGSVSGAGGSGGDQNAGGSGGSASGSAGAAGRAGSSSGAGGQNAGGSGGSLGGGAGTSPAAGRSGGAASAGAGGLPMAGTGGAAEGGAGAQGLSPDELLEATNTECFSGCDLLSTACTNLSFDSCVAECRLRAERAYESGRCGLELYAGWACIAREAAPSDIVCSESRITVTTCADEEAAYEACA